LSLVLAIGLGLGNLVAYNECEAEHKAPNLKEELDTPSNNPVGQDAPKVSDSSISSSSPIPSVPSPIPAIPKHQFQKDSLVYESSATKQDANAGQKTSTHSVEDEIIVKPVRKIEDPNKPILDPKYADQAETLAKVVKGLDDLARKIDLFENATRKLGGVIMLNYEEEETDHSKSTFPDSTATNNYDALKQEHHNIDSSDKNSYGKGSADKPGVREDPYERIFTNMKKVIEEDDFDIDEWIGEDSRFLITEDEKDQLKRLWEEHVNKLDEKMRVLKEEFSRELKASIEHFEDEDVETNLDLDDIILTEDLELQKLQEQEVLKVREGIAKAHESGRPKRKLERQDPVNAFDDMEMNDDIIVQTKSNKPRENSSFHQDNIDEKSADKKRNNKEDSKAQKRRQKLAKKMEKKQKRKGNFNENSEFQNDSHKNEAKKRVVQENWQSSRAKARKFSREKKLVDSNWQINRDRIREKQRSSGTKVR